MFAQCSLAVPTMLITLLEHPILRACRLRPAHRRGDQHALDLLDDARWSAFTANHPGRLGPTGRVRLSAAPAPSGSPALAELYAGSDQAALLHRPTQAYLHGWCSTNSADGATSLPPPSAKRLSTCVSVELSACEPLPLQELANGLFARFAHATR